MSRTGWVSMILSEPSMTTKEIMQRATSETIVRMPVGLQGEEGIVVLFSSGLFSPHTERGRGEKKRDERDDSAARQTCSVPGTEFQIGPVRFVLFAPSSLDLYPRHTLFLGLLKRLGRMGGSPEEHPRSARLLSHSLRHSRSPTNRLGASLGRPA